MFINKKFGFLTPIIHVRGSWWVCECYCGNFALAEAKKIRDGLRKSCGCLNGRGRIRDQKEKKPVLSREDQGFKQLKKHYTSHKREFSLTENEFRILVKSNCFYCGVEPKQKIILSARENDNTKKYIFLYNGIDRQNNEIGYIIENCVPCCGTCN